MGDKLEPWEHNGKIYSINYEDKTVDCPQSVDREGYPAEILSMIHLHKYRVQLTIE